MDDLIERTLERTVNRIGSTYYGKYRGIVTDVDADQCRVRARLDNLLDGEVTGWALPASPFAGDGHGMVLLPAIGSGVWIEFEAGNLDLPIWSGGWWASGQPPGPQAKVRTIVSETGNQVILDDNNDEVRIEHHGINAPKITISSSEVVITVGACTLSIGSEAISLNNGLIKVGIAGVSLVNGAMTFGFPP
jgi:phage baseplate assembly protein gpV